MTIFTSMTKRISRWRWGCILFYSKNDDYVLDLDFNFIIIAHSRVLTLSYSTRRILALDVTPTYQRRPINSGRKVFPNYLNPSFQKVYPSSTPYTNMPTLTSKSWHVCVVGNLLIKWPYYASYICVILSSIGIIPKYLLVFLFLIFFLWALPHLP